MTFKKEILLVLFFSIFLPINSFALTIPEKPTGYVNDYAGLLSKEATVQISANLSSYEKETSNQIVVAVFKSLEGESLEDFSIKLAEKWKVGTKDKDNGVIFLVFKDDRKVRIEVGYGLEGALTDAISSEIIRKEIIPNFKAGNFDDGISNAVNAIINATKGEYKASPTKTKGDNQALFSLIIFLFFIMPLLAYIATVFLCVSFFGFPMGLIIALPIIAILEVIKRIFFNYSGETFSGRGNGFYGGGFGGGGFSSGGGFSGFSGGGGSFGGGGSSGDW